MVVRSDEVFENRAPLLRTLAVSSSLASEHERAADVRECLQGGRLATCHRRHGLVKPGQAALGLAHRHLGEAELRERPKFEICVARSECHVESSRRQRRCRRRVPYGFRAREVEPALLGPRRYVSQETLGACEPAA